MEQVRDLTGCRHYADGLLTGPGSGPLGQVDACAALRTCQAQCTSAQALGIPGWALHAWVSHACGAATDCSIRYAESIAWAEGEMFTCSECAGRKGGSSVRAWESQSTPATHPNPQAATATHGGRVPTLLRAPPQRWTTHVCLMHVGGCKDPAPTSLPLHRRHRHQPQPPTSPLGCHCRTRGPLFNALHLPPHAYVQRWGTTALGSKLSGKQQAGRRALSPGPRAPGCRRQAGRRALSPGPRAPGCRRQAGRRALSPGPRAPGCRRQAGRRALSPGPRAPGSERQAAGGRQAPRARRRARQPAPPTWPRSPWPLHPRSAAPCRPPSSMRRSPLPRCWRGRCARAAPWAAPAWQAPLPSAGWT